MPLIATIGRLAYKWRDARARHATERQISSLPFELQKDIGWRDASGDPVPYRRSRQKAAPCAS